MESDSSSSRVAELFNQVFGSGGSVSVIRSPGRVNLIGEHTDYNDGFVFPMAIEPEVVFAFRARTDGMVRVASMAFPGQMVEFSLNQKIERAEPKWGNYLRGVAAGLLEAGIPLCGMEALIDNTLPVGGGLSSSAAIEVGMAHALLQLAGVKLDLAKLASLCQRAEHEYAMVPCGIMDQTIVTTGKAGHAMLLDCRTLATRHVPMSPDDVWVVIVNSMVKHQLSDSEYAQRRRQCEEGVAYFQKTRPQVKALRDISADDLEAAKGELSDVVYRRCRHVISENQRTMAFATLLEARQYVQAGKLMVQSHNSLRDDYQVSCPELDYLVEDALAVDGVYGARMTGAGFGGSIVALARPAIVTTLRRAITGMYREKFRLNPSIFVTTAAAGASVLPGR